MRWLEFKRRLFGCKKAADENFFTLRDVKDNKVNLAREFLSLSDKRNIYYLKPKTFVKVAKIDEKN